MRLTHRHPPATRPSDLPEPHPIVAFRNWRLVDGVLRSPYRGNLWEEPIMCARGDRGIAAYTDPQTDFSTIDFRGVSGIVSLWGSVCTEGEVLYGEFARVEALAVYHCWTGDHVDAVMSAAEAIGADVVDLAAQGAAAQALRQTRSQRVDVRAVARRA